jgi:hypothetical protein
MLQDHIHTIINECENIIKDEKMKQEDNRKKIKYIGINKKKLDKIVQDIRSRIESYKPYEVYYIVIMLVQQYDMIMQKHQKLLLKHFFFHIL